MSCRCKAHRHLGEGRCTFSRQYGTLRACCTCPDALSPAQHQALRVAYDQELAKADDELLDHLSRVISAFVPEPEPPPLPPAPTEREPAMPIHYTSYSQAPAFGVPTLCGEVTGPFRCTRIATLVTCPRCLEIIYPTHPRRPA